MNDLVLMMIIFNIIRMQIYIQIDMIFKDWEYNEKLKENKKNTL